MIYYTKLTLQCRIICLDKVDLKRIAPAILGKFNLPLPEAGAV